MNRVERPSWFRTERPERIEVYFCSICGFACGIRDYDRIRHEHFDQEGSLCRGGRWDIRTYVADTSAITTSRGDQP